MNELLSYYDRIDYEKQILDSDDFSSQKLIIIGKGQKGEKLTPYLVEDEKEAISLFGQSELSKSFSEAKDAGARLIYLMRIEYNSYKEKSRQLRMAYEIIETTPVDIILLANTSIEEKHYHYPVIRDYISVGFSINALKGKNVLDTVHFPETYEEPIILNTDNNIEKITDKVVKDYFKDLSSGFVETFNYENKSDFSHLINKSFSSDYMIKDNKIMPLEYETYVGHNGRVNDPKGYLPEAEIITGEFRLENNLDIERIKVKIKGDFHDWRSINSVEIFYDNDGKFEKIENNKELIVRDKNIKKTFFKFKFNNANYINPPKIESVEIKITYSSVGNYNYFHLNNNHPYVKMWTKNDGSDYVYASFNKEEFINQNTFSRYLVTDLAAACRKLNAIGILKGPEKKHDESLDEYKSRAKKIIKDIKYRLEKDDLRKYISCVLSFGFIKKDNSIYLNSLESAYSGLFSSLYSNQSPTNKNIENIDSLNNHLSDSDLKDLSNYGYTVIYKTIRNGIVPFKAISLVEDQNSSFLSINSTRIGNEVIKKVNEITDEYIGKGFYYNTNEIRKDLEKVLKELVDDEKISEFNIKFKIVDSSEVIINIFAKINDEIFEINITDKNKA